MKKAIEIRVNGRDQRVEVDTRMVLADMLRDVLGLTGTHVGCGTGSCGACTVLLDDCTVKSCCILAVDTDGCEVTTIEGLSQGAELHPIQEAFVENQGLQCGYCTPGMVLSTLQLLRHHPQPDEATIRHGIAGNLCRCTGYQLIVRAVEAAARKLGGAPPG